MKTAVMACMLLCCSVAHADVMTGKKLYSWLSSNDGALRLAAAMYIAGVVDDDMVLQAAILSGDSKPDKNNDIRHICLPKNASNQQIRGPVQDVLRDFPATQSAPAIMTIRQILSSVYSCPRKS